MSLSAQVRQCLVKFKAVEELDSGRPDIEDEHGRFRIWVANIAAHRSGGRRSLEYRLRDSSSLQSMVVSLLQDLLQALDGLQNIIKDRPKLLSDESIDQQDVGQGSADEDSEDEDDAALFGVEKIDQNHHDPASRVLEEIREINLCLLRFSMTLRNPARHDQMKEAASTSTQHFERFDMDHVRAKFPEAESFLHERLGKGISKHRQYFRYREEHHSKLAEGLDDEDIKHERPSTIATSLNVPTPEAATPQGDELETESLYTATSFAPTTAGDSPLRPPPLPEAGQDGSPFECPLCFGIIVAEDERAWRQHVYEDLPPYICTYTDCITANQRYSRRRDWQRHQASAHNRHWLCPFGCSNRFDSEHVFLKHLMKQHAGDDSTHRRLLETCAVASNEASDLDCPLCQKQLSSSKLWMKHLGHHLEQLALHAIPKHLFTLDSDNEDGQSVETGQSGRSSESSAVEHQIERDIDRLPDDVADEISIPLADEQASTEGEGPSEWIPKGGEQSIAQFGSGSESVRASSDGDASQTDAEDSDERSNHPPKKGKTRCPKNLVRVEAIREYGYEYREEEDFYVILVALSKKSIDELLELSKSYDDPRPLPDGWIRRLEDDSYVHLATQHTQKEFPTGPPVISHNYGQFEKFYPEESPVEKEERRQRFDEASLVNNDESVTGLEQGGPQQQAAPSMGSSDSEGGGPLSLPEDQRGALSGHGEATSEQQRRQPAEDQPQDFPVMQQLDEVKMALLEFKDECEWFSRGASTDEATTIDSAHKRLSKGAVDHILIPLDGLSVEGNDEARAVRKSLVAECQHMLNQLDKARLTRLAGLPDPRKDGTDDIVDEQGRGKLDMENMPNSGPGLGASTAATTLDEAVKHVFEERDSDYDYDGRAPQRRRSRSSTSSMEYFRSQESPFYARSIRSRTPSKDSERMIELPTTSAPSEYARDQIEEVLKNTSSQVFHPTLSEDVETTRGGNDERSEALAAPAPSLYGSARRSSSGERQVRLRRDAEIEQFSQDIERERNRRSIQIGRKSSTNEYERSMREEQKDLDRKEWDQLFASVSEIEARRGLETTTRIDDEAEEEIYQRRRQVSDTSNDGGLPGQSTNESGFQELEPRSERDIRNEIKRVEEERDVLRRERDAEARGDYADSDEEITNIVGGSRVRVEKDGKGSMFPREEGEERREEERIRLKIEEERLEARLRDRVRLRKAKDHPAFLAKQREKEEQEMADKKKKEEELQELQRLLGEMRKRLGKLGNTDA